MGSFEYNQAFPDELCNALPFRRFMKGIGEDVQREIPRHLPIGRAGGRRVRPFATKSYVWDEGVGRNYEVEVGTRWRVGTIIEFGSRTSPAYAPVRKAAQSAGLLLTGGGR